MKANTAIILAGGKSQRMGFDKKNIKIEGMYLLDSIVNVLEKEFDKIIIVTNTPCRLNKSNIIYVYDELKDIGPLGGIHAGLKASNSKYNYLIACDMPYINLDYIKFMKNKLKGNPDAVITRYKNWIEPFNGIYSKNLINKIEEYTKENKRNIFSLLDISNVLYVKEDTARDFSPDWKMFQNLNTKKELVEYVNYNKQKIL